ncbi:MAG: hypothetical protein K0B85_02070 [Coriobacteriia bacterium]|nr:hypothetical protein [Coriobacteriia bacterium]
MQQVQAVQARRTGPAVLTAIAVVLALVAIYSGVTAFRVESYLARADSTEERVTETLATLGAEAAAFQTSPAAAERLSPQLRSWKDEFESLRAEALDTAVPALPFSGGTGEHADAIVDHLDATIEYVDLLAASSEFAVVRAEEFDEVVTALDRLSALSGDEIEVDEARTIVASVREDLGSAMDRMRGNPPPVPVLFSNTHLLWRLDEISDRLAEVEAGIVARDAEQIQSALGRYAELAGDDWTSFLIAQDHQGQQSLYVAAAGVREAAERVESTRERVSRARDIAFLVALVCLVAAIVIGFVVLSLRTTDR